MKTKKTKILLINFGGLGDQILFFPAIKAIKKIYPDSHITFATEPRSGSAEKLTDLIDETIICDIKSGNKYKNIINFLLKIWSRKFDLVVSSGSSQQVAVLLFLTGIKKRIGYDSGALSRILLTKAVPLNQKQYAGDMYHDLAKALNPEAVVEFPEISVPDEILEKQREIMASNQAKVIVIHPGVSKLSIQKNILKFWDVKNWTELIKRLLDTGKYRVILTGGKDDEEVSDALKKELGEILSENFLDLTNKTANIIELAAIIKLADVLVCVDSAPMHIGVGVKTPTIALFGPTDEYKLFPMQDNKFIAITAENLECRPCLWDKRQVSCENPICLDIPVEKVFEAIEKSINI
jgi:ADP-heptose:LPS heptosyltransferase